jgi:hypothetical protein
LMAVPAKPTSLNAKVAIVRCRSGCWTSCSAKIAHVALAFLGMELARLVTHAPKLMLLRGWLLKAASPKS